MNTKQEDNLMKRVLLTALASMLLLTGCVTSKDTIIKVNNQPITQTEFNKEFKKVSSDGMLAQMNIQIPQDDNNFMYLMLKDKIVNELIVKSLINQAIKERHIKVTKADMDNEIKIMIDKVGSKEQFNEILKRNGVSNEQFMKDLKEEVKVKKLVNMIENVKISDKEAQIFYNKNQKKFTYPDKVRASHILIMANPMELERQIKSKPENKELSEEIVKQKVEAEMQARYQKAQQIEASLKNLPDNFEKVAREKSDDVASAKNGGDLGFFAKSDMVEPFSKQAFAQQPNTISPVIQTPYGFHIIKVTDRMAAGKEPFVKVKEQIKLYLQTQKQMEILEKLLTQLKSSAKIEYVNESYNPVNIQAKLKEMAKQKQQAAETVNPEKFPAGASKK